MAYTTKSGDTWDVLATPVLEEERDGLLPPWKYEASYE